ncbi:heterokaryon incompatibility protein (HET) domain-containing protein [Trichoderma breve]|uniref:Heterokaryon incompatibility protein (HET) domain-containing protein n=1 Tax=Trichoderma breve TaxID=2034170 RepID=A0A9W9E4M7_9HYPO|nr:heterokaryon incompatibility protein (HET) domain-containing protein [Trichoderma breve]KAJ4857180.1 heterokaryon incompatibility protein (HET) domain-containing protein [Trichoderma breve]
MESNFQDIIPGSDPSKERKHPTEASHTRTMPEEPPSVEFLCQDCANLDLSEAFSAKDGAFYDAPIIAPGYFGYFNLWAVNVGHRYRVTRITDCILCQILFNSRADEGDSELGGDGDWIRAVSFYDISGLFAFANESNDFPFLMLFSNKWYDLWKNRERVRHHVQQSGYAALQQLNQQHAGPISLKAIPPEQSIAEHEPGMPYVALSYVWGQPQKQREMGDGKQLPAQLPLLIRDAMVITQAMGFRYLWVDRYCIDQNNSTVKHGQIRQMGAIYSNAEVTIIAAAGQDENYGLSGDPQAAIKSSKWSTRGWTFQEAVLSRRRLVFTEQQVYFELHIDDRSKSHQDGPNEVFGRYLSNVEEYSTRKLTYAEDSLNAFRGIAQQFWYRKHAVHNIWGMAYRMAPDKRTSSFVQSLTWRHAKNCWDLSQSPQRRPQFPSWSWAGWEGEVRYEFMFSKHTSWFVNLMSAVSFENQIDSPIALEMIEPNPNETCIFPIVILTAAVIPSELISFHPDATPRQHWRIGEYKAFLSLSYESVSECQFANDIHDSHTWQCVCIGGVLGKSSVMILKVGDGSDVWERAGVFALECYASDLKDMKETWEYKSFRVE